MATKKNNNHGKVIHDDAPMTLEDNMFFGLARTMNDEQRSFVETMWRGAKDGRIVFVEGKSGSGKTTLAVLLAVLAMQYGLANRTYYIRAMGVGGERKIGFLPGMTEKVKPYFVPAEQALLAGGLRPQDYISYDGFTDDYLSEYPIICSGDGYLRGVNLGNAKNDDRAIVIIDEAQNLTIDGLRLILTRVFDNSLVVVMGHTAQIDLDDKEQSGFTTYIKHFRKRPDLMDYVKLNVSMRGEIATWADEIDC
jgi:predicted ribonuclease YlaK